MEPSLKPTLPLIKKERKWLFKFTLGQKFFIIVGLFLILFLAAIIYLFYDFKYAKGTVYINGIPKEAKILIDNKEYAYKENLKIKLAKGKHTIKIEKENFWPFEHNIVITAGHQVIKIKPNLSPLSLPVKIAENISHPGIFVQDNQNYFLYSQAGYLYILRLDNLKTERLTSFLPNLNDVVWNLSQKIAFIQQDSYAKLIDFSYYNFTHPEIIFLGRQIKNAIFSPNGEKMAYLVKKNKRFFLATMELFHRQEDLIVDVKNVSLAKLAFMSSGNQIVLLPRLKQYNQNYLYLVDFYTRRLNRLTSKGNITGFLISPDSQKILFSRYDGKSPSKNHLYLIDLNPSVSSGREEKDLGILISIKNCVWVDKDIFLYADVEGGLFKYNIDSGQKTELHYPRKINNKELRPSNLLLYPDRQNLIFRSGKIIYLLRGSF